MKLELKHLAPYLPYNVITEYNLTSVDPSYPYEYRTKILNENTVDFCLKFCNPYLRPLSDLTKEIEHNGENFVPTKVILSEYLTDNKWGANHIGTGVMSYDNNMLALCFIGNDIVGECPLMIYELLIKWHFDVFGLIDQGLAIDKNSLAASQPDTV